MTEFLIAIAAFLLAHAVPPVPAVRVRLIALFGRRAYLTLYSLLSLALIVWVISAAVRAPYLPVWHPAPWHAAVPIVLMPFAAWFLMAGLAEPSPLSISIRAAEAGESPKPMATVTRHPVLWGFLLWAAAHIPPTGHVVALILFGGMALLALAGMFALDRRARRKLGEEKWRAMAGRSPLIPFAAILSGRAHFRFSPGMAWSLGAALLLYLWLLLDGHRRLIGPDPLVWF